MDLDDLSSKMVVLQPLIELKPVIGRRVLEFYGPLRLEELFVIKLQKFVFLGQYNPSGLPKPCRIDM